MKDYIEVTNKLLESDFTKISTLSSYNDFGAIFTFFILSLKEFFTGFHFSNVWSFPIVIPNIDSAIISEISVFDSHFENTFNYLDTPTLNWTNPVDFGAILYDENHKLFLYSMQKFMLGLINSLFLWLPTSVAHLIILRRFVLQGLQAGYLAGLGTIAGNILWIGSIIFGLRFVVIPWLALDTVRYLLGFFILMKYMWDTYKAKYKIRRFRRNSGWKIFSLNMLLAFTEQTNIYPFLKNFSVTPESTILETFPANSLTEYYCIHGCYLLGLLIGCLLLLNFMCWVWEKPAYDLYMWTMTSFNIKIGTYYKVVYFVFLYLTMVFTFCSTPYYGLDYTLTNPMGYVHEDKLFGVSLRDKYRQPILETSSLYTKASDPDLRAIKGFSDPPDEKKIETLQARDISLYDQGIYDIFTIEDLNYGFDRFWFERRAKVPRIEKRLGLPGRFLYKFRRILVGPAKDRIKNYRTGFFLILSDYFYEPTFHDYKKKKSQQWFGFGQENKVKTTSKKQIASNLTQVHLLKTFNPLIDNTKARFLTKQLVLPLGSHSVIDEVVELKKLSADSMNYVSSAFTYLPLGSVAKQANQERYSAKVFEKHLDLVTKFSRKFSTRLGLKKQPVTIAAKASRLKDKLEFLLKKKKQQLLFAKDKLQLLLLQSKRTNKNPSVKPVAKLAKQEVETLATSYSLQQDIVERTGLGQQTETMKKKMNILLLCNNFFDSPKKKTNIFHFFDSPLAAEKKKEQNLHQRIFGNRDRVNAAQEEGTVVKDKYFNFSQFQMLKESLNKKKKGWVKEILPLEIISDITVNDQAERKISSFKKKDQNFFKIKTTASSEKQEFTRSGEKPEEKTVANADITSSPCKARVVSTIEQSHTADVVNARTQLLHPIKYYYEKEKSFQRKLNLYGVNLYRKSSNEKNTTIFRIMMKRIFYSYKPTKTWENTMESSYAKNKPLNPPRGPRKLSSRKKPRPLFSWFISQDEEKMEGKSELPLDKEQVKSQSVAANVGTVGSKARTLGKKQEDLAIPTLPNRTEGSNIPNKTSSYTVFGAQAAIYRTQIYRDVLEFWYYSPFNRLLLKLDIDSFISRQPKAHFLTKKEERLLHLRRFLLSEHYNTLRWYTQMQHYETMKSRIGGTKSLSSRTYNQQFVGTFKKVRHLFAITPGLTEQSVLKFDQPLFLVARDKLPNNNLIYYHEELMNDDPDLSLATKVASEQNNQLDENKQIVVAAEAATKGRNSLQSKSLVNTINNLPTDIEQTAKTYNAFLSIKNDNEIVKKPTQLVAKQEVNRVKIENTYPKVIATFGKQLNLFNTNTLPKGNVILTAKAAFVSKKEEKHEEKNVRNLRAIKKHIFNLRLKKRNKKRNVFLVIKQNKKQRTNQDRLKERILLARNSLAKIAVGGKNPGLFFIADENFSDVIKPQTQKKTNKNIIAKFNLLQLELQEVKDLIFNRNTLSWKNVKVFIKTWFHKGKVLAFQKGKNILEKLVHRQKVDKLNKTSGLFSKRKQTQDLRSQEYKRWIAKKTLKIRRRRLRKKFSKVVKQKSYLKHQAMKMLKSAKSAELANSLYIKWVISHKSLRRLYEAAKFDDDAISKNTNQRRDNIIKKITLKEQELDQMVDYIKNNDEKNLPVLSKAEKRTIIKLLALLPKGKNSCSLSCYYKKTIQSLTKNQSTRLAELEQKLATSSLKTDEQKLIKKFKINEKGLRLFSNMKDPEKTLEKTIIKLSKLRDKDWPESANPYLLRIAEMVKLRKRPNFLRIAFSLKTENKITAEDFRNFEAVLFASSSMREDQIERLTKELVAKDYKKQKRKKDKEFIQKLVQKGINTDLAKQDKSRLEYFRLHPVYFNNLLAEVKIESFDEEEKSRADLAKRLVYEILSSEDFYDKDYLLKDLTNNDGEIYPRLIKIFKKLRPNLPRNLSRDEQEDLMNTISSRILDFIQCGEDLPEDQELITSLFKISLSEREKMLQDLGPKNYKELIKKSELYDWSGLSRKIRALEELEYDGVIDDLTLKSKTIKPFTNLRAAKTINTKKTKYARIADRKNKKSAGDVLKDEMKIITSKTPRYSLQRYSAYSANKPKTREKLLWYLKIPDERIRKKKRFDFFSVIDPSANTNKSKKRIYALTLNAIRRQKRDDFDDRYVTYKHTRKVKKKPIHSKTKRARKRTRKKMRRHTTTYRPKIRTKLKQTFLTYEKPAAFPSRKKDFVNLEAYKRILAVYGINYSKAKTIQTQKGYEQRRLSGATQSKSKIENSPFKSLKLVINRLQKKMNNLTQSIDFKTINAGDIGLPTPKIKRVYARKRWRRGLSQAKRRSINRTLKSKRRLMMSGRSRLKNTFKGFYAHKVRKKNQKTRRLNKKIKLEEISSNKNKKVFEMKESLQLINNSLQMQHATLFAKQENMLEKQFNLLTKDSSLPQTTPFYAGWDESLRQFIITNRILSRQEIDDIDYSKGVNHENGIVAVTPFSLYGTDLYYSFGNHGFAFAPIQWRRVEFRHTLLNTWRKLQKKLSPLNNFDLQSKSQVALPLGNSSTALAMNANQLNSQPKLIGACESYEVDEHMCILNETNSINKDSRTDVLNVTLSSKENNIERKIILNSKKEIKHIIPSASAQNATKILSTYRVNDGNKKTRKKFKKFPYRLMVKNGPLINDVFPVYYLLLFASRNRDDVNTLSHRYVGINKRINKRMRQFKQLEKKQKRAMSLKISKGKNSVAFRQTDVLLPEFTFRRRITNRSRFKSFTFPKQKFKPHQTKEFDRWRPFKKKRLKLTSDVISLRDPKEPKFQRKVEPNFLLQPESGGFVWAGDYLRLEQSKIPRVQKTPQIVKSNKKQKKKGKKKPRVFNDIINFISPNTKRSLIQQHNKRVIKKKLEKAQRILK